MTDTASLNREGPEGQSSTGNDAGTPRAAGRIPNLVGVFLLFFGSGVVALVYEVAWTRLLTLEMGSSTLAVSTVLSVFMAGLAIGARVAGPLADRLSRPLLAYGLLELGIGVYAVCTPYLFGLVASLFALLGAGTSPGIWWLSVLRFIIAGVLLIPPTMLMGATLPLLVRHCGFAGISGGRIAGILYGINTCGAFAGTVLSGLILLPTVGLRKCILAAAAINLLLGIVAALWGRAAGLAASAAPPDPVPGRRSRIAEISLLLAIAATGFAAMVCQVAWSRVLVLIVGPSVYAFTVMLATFLIGLGGGSSLVAVCLKNNPGMGRLVFAVLAGLSGVLILVSSGTFQYLPSLFLKLFRGLGIEEDPDAHTALLFLVSGSVMIVPTLVMGGLFPACSVALMDRERSRGEDVGRLFSYNTIGAIVGSFAAGFVLVPLIGIRHSLLVAAILSTVASLVALLPRSGRSAAVAAALSGTGLLAAWALTPDWDRQLMTSGVYKYTDYFKTTKVREMREFMEGDERVLFYRDGLTATITVIRDLKAENSDLYLSTNGKIDGSSHRDMPTQRLAAHLPILLHRAPDNVCVIGLGTGCTAGSASLHPGVDVDVVEIEAAVVEGARFFSLHNHNVHDRKNVKIHVTDGRLFVRLRPATYDVLISEPSNPWLAGASDLFTRDFFELGARSLREGGIFCQWVHLYGMSEESIRTVLRSFMDVFSHVYVASTIPGADIQLIGAREPIPFNLPRMERRMSIPAVEADLADPRVRVHSLAELLARIVLGPEEARVLAGAGPLNTDDHPVIAYTAPRSLYSSTRESNTELLLRHAKGMGGYLGSGGFRRIDRGITFRRDLEREFDEWMEEHR